MKIHHLFLTASLVAALLQGTAHAAPSAPDKDSTDSKATKVATDNLLSTLKQAMAADVVRKIMGQPDEIRPLKAPNGKAEIWVYKRDVSDHMNRVPVASVPITTTSYGADGKAYTQTIGEDIKYADVHIVTVETIELLMFNDHYVTSKVTRQDVKRYS